VVIDPANPYILGPQLLCAATELPLDEAEVRALDATEVADGLVDDGLLRRRGPPRSPWPILIRRRCLSWPGIRIWLNRHQAGRGRPARGVPSMGRI